MTLSHALKLLPHVICWFLIAKTSRALFYCLHSLIVDMVFIAETLYVVIKEVKEALHPSFIGGFMKLLKLLSIGI